jgi:hypothetical protein
MSVAEGTLTDAFRSELLAFYGGHFGWKEMEELALPDRLTLSVGGGTYVNVRERRQTMVCHGYEHFGLLVASTDAAEAAWTRLEGESREVNLEPITRGDDGYRSFRFRYLLPFAVEVQYFP